MHKTYVAWLNNAYGQEQAMARMYEMHAHDASAGLNLFPELEARLLKQAAVARQHQELIAECLERHGLTPNPLKKVIGEGMGLGLGLTGDITIDKVIMNNLTDLGMAHFEVGAYLTLIAGAEYVGDDATKQICEQILVDERNFIDWMEQHAGGIAQRFLERTV